MTTSALRAGILGAGYISDFHLKAIVKQSNAELVAICDLNEQAAKKLAGNYDRAIVYTDLEKMLDEANLDVVHILTQPDSHYFLAKMVINAGCHAVIEKPVTVNSDQAIELKKLAEEKGVSIAINHNFVFSRPFNELKKAIDNGELGPLKSIRVVWKKILPQATFGPWNLWMLREPSNILFETGSHSLSELLAVIDKKPTIKRAAARLPKVLPSGSVFYRRWSIAAESGDISIQIDTAFDQGYEQHFVEVEGLFGVARADIENDVFTIDSPTGRAYDIERLRVNVREGIRRAKHGIRTYASYAGSKFLSSALGGPYEASMLCGISNCYDEVLKQSSRKESSIDYAIEIAKTAEAIMAKMPKTKEVAEKDKPTIPATVNEPGIDAKILIVGASGFIGKRLLMALQGKEKGVRALVRNASALVGVKLEDNCEVMVGDFRDEEVIEKALEGIETVFHLAVAHGNSLEGYLKADSEPTLKFARLCLEKNIKRFIYTGTIDSLALANPGKIKESDGVDSNLKRRNNYAHSKAITESKLTEMHKQDGFPLVIIRPAIVLGAGGPVNHVGVANWFGLGRCSYWGKGFNNIPAVLVDDIVNGLIAAIDAPNIEGNTYNLSAESCISARDYVAEVEKVMGCKIHAEPSSAFGHWVGDMTKWIVKVAAGHPDKARIPSIHDWKCREQHAGFDTTRAQQDLNWAPENDRETIIEKGVREPTRLFLEG